MSAMIWELKVEIQYALFYTQVQIMFHNSNLVNNFNSDVNMSSLFLHVLLKTLRRI